MRIRRRVRRLRAAAVMRNWARRFRFGDALSGMGGPVKVLREATPQALHHFTRFDQVNQLIGANEADPDLGFMARLLALCSLPRTNPHLYARVFPYKIY